MKLVVKLLIATLAVFLSAYLIPGVSVDSFQTAFIVAIVLGVLNVFLKPLLVILALPVTILTLGLFSFVINIALIYLAAYIVPGFEISGILAALLFGLLVSIISSFLNLLSK